MFITKKRLSRRTALRGIGTVIALPILDAMVPALTAQGRTVAAAPLRFGAVYFPQGINLPDWRPASAEPGFALPRIVQALEPFRDQLVIVSGLETPNLTTHLTAISMFLNDAPPKRTEGQDISTDTTLDQLIAQKIGQDTPLPSLELGTNDMSGSIGACEFNYSCTYLNCMAWRNRTSPLPMELSPRKLFERMFGDAGSAEGRQARLGYRRSILDSVMEATRRVEQDLSVPDRARLGEYLDNLREVERQIQKAEEQSTSAVNVAAPLGTPELYQDHLQLMYDMAHLAWQADIARVLTFMTDHEFSQRAYNNLGISEGHHSLSHHRGDPERIKQHAMIPTYQTEVFARFVAKLRATPDGDGTLLDHAMLLYGSGMSDPNTHNKTNLPNVVVGGACGAVKGNRHVEIDRDSPNAHGNLLVALGQKAGLDIEQMGLSNGVVDL